MRRVEALCEVPLSWSRLAELGAAHTVREDGSNDTLSAEQRNDVQRRWRQKLDIERFRHRAPTSCVGARDVEALAEAVDARGLPKTRPIQRLAAVALEAWGGSTMERVTSDAKECL